MPIRFLSTGMRILFLGMLLAANALAQASGGQPETDLGIYSPKQHPLYDVPPDKPAWR